MGFMIFIDFHRFSEVFTRFQNKKARILLPNMLTLIGVCIGLSSIKFALDEKYSLSVIAGALSFIPGGVGIIEGSLGGLLSVQGIELSVAIAVGVIIRFFTLWYTVIVGFFALKLTGGFSLRESDSKDSDDNKNE